MRKIMLIFIFFIFNVLFAQESKILFYEGFEDTNFAERGWYDHLKGNLSSEEHIEGSNYSLEIKFLEGATGPEGGTPGRHLFDESDEVSLSYYVKYSDNYIGSGRPYHPHEFHFITNKDSKWVGPAFTHLTTYIEHSGGIPLIAIQDGENIDQSRVGQNLVEITEERGVAGCNGSSDGYPDDCYKPGNLYVNGKQWRANSKYFSDEKGNYYKNDWHHVEAYFKLNSIVDGIGIADGVIQYWYDGELIIDHDDILIRTGEHSDMKFNQFLIAPYIGDGSPIEQTMWIDDVTVSTSKITSNVDAMKIVEGFFIFPNPASDYIEINPPLVPPFSKGDAEGRGISSIKFYNSFGECVMTVGTRHAFSLQRIDVSHLPIGLYFINLGNYSEKFMVVR